MPCTRYKSPLSAKKPKAASPRPSSGNVRLPTWPSTSTSGRNRLRSRAEYPASPAACWKYCRVWLSIRRTVPVTITWDPSSDSAVPCSTASVVSSTAWAAANCWEWTSMPMYSALPTGMMYSRRTVCSRSVPLARTVSAYQP